MQRIHHVSHWAFPLPIISCVLLPLYCTKSNGFFIIVARKLCHRANSFDIPMANRCIPSAVRMHRFLFAPRVRCNVLNTESISLSGLGSRPYSAPKGVQVTV